MHAELASLCEQRIVYVGDIAHALDLVTEIDEASLQDVVRNECGCMTKVSGVVGRDAARVHRHLRTWLKWHHGLARRVEQPHAQGCFPSAFFASRGSLRMPVSLGATRVL